MATFTSKTLIPGQTPIGQNRDGSYIYEEVMSKATTAPKATTPIYTPPTAIAKIPTDGKTNFMPLVTPENARKPNAPVKDTLNFSKRIKNDDARVIQLREHFDYLKQNNELFLNDKQTDYIKRFKEKYPDYASVPDTILYGKVLLTDPKVQEKYGNIGEKTFMQSLGKLPFNIAKAGGEAVNRGVDLYNQGISSVPGEATTFDKIMSSIPAVLRAGGEGTLNIAGEVLNTADQARQMLPGPVGKDFTPNTTRFSEDLGNTVGNIAQKGVQAGDAITQPVADFIRQFIPEEYQQELRDANARNPNVIPQLQYMLESGMEIANILPFLKIKGPSPAWVDELASKKWVGEDAIQFVKEKTKQGAKTTNEWLKQLPDETQKIAKTVEKNVNKNREVLEGIRNTQTGEKILSKADNQGFDPIDDIARYEELQPVIDSDGRIDTTQAIDNLNAFVEPKAKTVRELIVAENKRISFDKYIKETRDILESKHLDDPDYDRWLKYVDDTLESYRNKKGYVDENGTIALEKIDDIKKTIANKKVNYLNENDQALKAIAEGARKTIENNVKNADIKKLNQELSRWYNTRDYLKSIGVGKVIKGGRMGKYFAKLAGQGAGAIAGGAIGGGAGAFVGGVVGGEVADAIQGKILSGAIKKTAGVMPESELFGQAKKTLGESPKQLMPPSTEGLPTSYSSRYSRAGEQLGQGEFPGANNTGLGDFANPKEIIPIASSEGKSLAISAENKTLDVKKLLEKFEQLSPEEKAKAKMASPRLEELVKVTTEIKDIQEFKGDFGYTPPEIIDSLGDNYLNYSPEAKEIIRKGLDKEDLATLQKMNREKAGLPEPVVEEKAKVTETKELPKKVTDLEEEIGMLDDNKGDRSSFVQKYDGADEYGTAGDAYDAVKDMDRFEFEDYASLWKDKDGGGMVPKNETASKIIDDIDGFADKLGISSDDAIILIRDGTGGSRYKENLANFKARYGVAPYQAKKKLAQFKKAWEAGKNPSIDDFLYKSDKTVDFSKPSKEEMAIENSKTPFDEPTPTETIEEVVTPVKDTPDVADTQKVSPVKKTYEEYKADQVKKYQKEMNSKIEASKKRVEAFERDTNSPGSRAKWLEDDIKAEKSFFDTMTSDKWLTKQYEKYSKTRDAQIKEYNFKKTIAGRKPKTPQEGKTEPLAIETTPLAVKSSKDVNLKPKPLAIEGKLTPEKLDELLPIKQQRVTFMDKGQPRLWTKINGEWTEGLTGAKASEKTIPMLDKMAEEQFVPASKIVEDLFKETEVKGKVINYMRDSGNLSSDQRIVLQEMKNLDLVEQATIDNPFIKGEKMNVWKLKDTKPKPSLPLSQKSEVKYSEPVKELEPVIKATQESRFVKKPVAIKKDVYRGVSNDEYTGKGMATYGNGLYTTTNKSIAKEYAGSNGKLLEISKTQLPENALHFDTVMDYKNWLDYDVQKKLGMKASEFNAKYPDIGEFIKSLGYDGIVVGKGEIMVTYP